MRRSAAAHGNAVVDFNNGSRSRIVFVILLDVAHLGCQGRVVDVVSPVHRGDGRVNLRHSQRANRKDCHGYDTFDKGKTLDFLGFHANHPFSG
jgi:hypothetical protein